MTIKIDNSFAAANITKTFDIRVHSHTTNAFHTMSATLIQYCDHALAYSPAALTAGAGTGRTYVVLEKQVPITAPLLINLHDYFRWEPTCPPTYDYIVRQDAVCPTPGLALAFGQTVKYPSVGACSGPNNVTCGTIDVTAPLSGRVSFVADPVPIGLNTALPQCFLLEIRCWDTINSLAKYQVEFNTSRPSYY